MHKERRAPYLGPRRGSRPPHRVPSTVPLSGHLLGGEELGPHRRSQRGGGTAPHARHHLYRPVKQDRLHRRRSHRLEYFYI
jgi:hypothetical protein